MTLALQLVTYFSSPHLEGLFASLAKQTLQGWTLYVRDQSQNTEEEQRVKRFLEASGIPYLFEAGENRGFAAGHNALFAKQTAEAVALVNPDIVFSPTYYEEVLKCLESRSELGSVQGVLTRIQEDQEVIDSLGLRVLGLGDVRDLGAGEPTASWQKQLGAAPMRSIMGVSGAAGVYRRSAIEASTCPTGPFLDERFFLYKEDVELAIRLWRGGWLSTVATRARARHLRSVGRGTLWQRLQAEQKRSDIVRVSSYIGQWRIYLLHGEWLGSLQSWGRTILAEAGRTLGLLLSPSLLVRAWRGIIGERHSLLATRKLYKTALIRRWRP